MSYDINFWKPKPGATTPAGEIYSKLNNQQPLDELEPLPLDAIFARLTEAFPSYDPTEEFPLVELPEGAMEVSHGPQHVRFDFRGPETGAEKAKVWQIMSGFGCVCYDPQTGELHTADNPPDYRPLTPEEAAQVDKLLGGRDIASMMKHMQAVQARRARIGCTIVALIGGILVGAIASLVYFMFFR